MSDKGYYVILRITEGESTLILGEGLTPLPAPQPNILYIPLCVAFKQKEVLQNMDYLALPKDEGGLLEVYFTTKGWIEHYKGSVPPLYWAYYFQIRAILLRG